jgi:hypothetical protein
MIPRFLLLSFALLLGGCATTPYVNTGPNRFLVSDAGFPPYQRMNRYAANPWRYRPNPTPHLHSSRYWTGRPPSRNWRNTRGRATISPNRNVFINSPRSIAPPPRVIRVR